MENETEKIEISGTVVFIRSNTGSKSEATLPYLYANKDEMTRILVNGDNPFENNMLIPFDGKRVTVLGNKKNNGTFVIENIL